VAVYEKRCYNQVKTFAASESWPLLHSLPNGSPQHDNFHHHHLQISVPLNFEHIR